MAADNGLTILSVSDGDLNLPVENSVKVEHVKPEGDLLRLELSGAGATAEPVLTRKLIFATGREGTGAPKIPDFVADLPASAWAHTADDIDFAALKGKLQRASIIKFSKEEVGHYEVEFGISM